MTLEMDLATYSEIEPSLLSEHPRACCSLAKLQVLSRLNHGSIASALSSVPALVEWAPTRWPHHWCALVATGVDSFRGDCGVHAALARLLLSQYSITHHTAAIAIEDYGFARQHWKAAWEHKGVDTRWIGSTSVYHEVVYVTDRFWDPSEARWFGGVGATLDCGRVVASRVGVQQWHT
jgi:hypothetical protein